MQEKHGAKSRRGWRKLHLAVDADSGLIVAHTLTDQDDDDPSQVTPLLAQIDGEIAKVTAEGAYDGAPTYQTIAQHGAGIVTVIPPRSTAVRSCAHGPPTQRDHHLETIGAQCRLAWQAATGYGRRARVETSMGHYKELIGPSLRARESTSSTHCPSPPEKAARHSRPPRPIIKPDGSPYNSCMRHRPPFESFRRLRSNPSSLQVSRLR
ncbi:transposase [Paraburkholderia bryophila]|uniref:transposase n=1 Tax=Paraburkholderia bryophila TaxID=420952 RepID=UPI0015CE3795